MKYIKKNTNNQSSNKLTKRCKIAKKISVAVIAALTIMAMAAMTVFAAGASGKVDTTDFINKTVTVLQSVISLIGAGLGVWGVVNLIEGYGNDNPGAKSQGIKQLMSGGGIIIVAQTVIPQLTTLFS